MSDPVIDVRPPDHRRLLPTEDPDAITPPSWPSG